MRRRSEEQSDLGAITSGFRTLGDPETRAESEGDPTLETRAGLTSPRTGQVRAPGSLGRLFEHVNSVTGSRTGD